MKNLILFIILIFSNFGYSQNIEIIELSDFSVKTLTVDTLFAVSPHPLIKKPTDTNTGYMLLQDKRSVVFVYAMGDDNINRIDRDINDATIFVSPVDENFNNKGTYGIGLDFVCIANDSRQAIQIMTDSLVILKKQIVDEGHSNVTWGEVIYLLQETTDKPKNKLPSYKIGHGIPNFHRAFNNRQIITLPLPLKKN